MTETQVLGAAARDRVGKGGARAVRRDGRIPAVIYGNREESRLISLDGAQLAQQLRRPGFLTHVYEIDVDGSRERVLAREVQTDPVSGRPLHVDFMRFTAATKITVAVEVHFENEAKAPGVKKGGVLNVVMREVEVVCSPDAIPQVLSVDVGGLDIGDVVHIGALVLPAGVELAITDEDATVASIAAPTTEEVAAEPTEEEEEAGAGGAG
ncbi:MAG: 50S ribosomal protein L25/general stress protein Ctc [Rhodospirillales bacterium]